MVTRVIRFVLVWFLLCARGSWADEMVLSVEVPPGGGLVVAEVDLTAAAQWCEAAPVWLRSSQCVGPEGTKVPFQFVPAADYDPKNRIKGKAIFLFADEPPGRVLLSILAGDAAPDVDASWDGIVELPELVVTHDAGRMGGLPSRLVFKGSGKVFDSFRWNDRVYDRQLGWFGLANDPQPEVERVSCGPLCTVVRVRARYVDSAGKQPPSQPEAIYDWYYFRQFPLVFVEAVMRQQHPFAWPEHHFLELNYPQEAFPQWAGGEPLKRGRLTGSKASLRFSRWAAVMDGSSGIGLIQGGQPLIYAGGSGTYLHAYGDAAWRGWNTERADYAAWLWAGSCEDPAAAVQSVAARVPGAGPVLVSVDSVRRRIEKARQSVLARAPGSQAAWWSAVAAEELEARGRLAEADRAAKGILPDGWHGLQAGRLGMILEQTAGGIRLVNLFDLDGLRPLLARPCLPLFELVLGEPESGQELRLTADSGWKQVTVAPGAVAKRQTLMLRWEGRGEGLLRGLVVETRVAASEPDGLCWTLRVDNRSPSWSLRRVVFPQVSVADLGDGAEVLFPRGPGEVNQDLWERAFRYSGTYPSGWTTMQFLAAYNANRTTGLYVAVHDPLASTKDMRVESRPAERSVVLSMDHPAPDMGRAGNDFRLSGEAVTALLAGDWFDAAVRYRRWVRQHARWYPELGPEGRRDTPQWMRELSAWALGGGAAEQCVPAVRQFARYLDLPAGFHWYNWHQIPFDNDYPHYFPTKPGFRRGVKELQAARVFVMPYINGRLWDTRDRGDRDYEFTKVALAGATKDEQGRPYTESYASKEEDGSPVKLAPMCPATRVWQEKVREIVLRLFDDCGVRGVYIDQVAAASPRLCFDNAHGHPLGGGHWWTESYWQLLEAIREKMPEDRMLTTECNAEPYIRWFDGYLTWHWQHDGQVPAFPAVYGGTIQMFGRAYRGGPTRHVALRMKAGQQLVFGEQVGWIDPGVARDEASAAFFRQIVRLRWRLRRYFYAGQMERPPKLEGEIPRLTADWQWHGEWPVTTPAVMTGAWSIPAERRAVLVFVNVSDRGVQARLDLQPAVWGLPRGPWQLTVIRPDDTGPPEEIQPGVRAMEFAPQTAFAWEIAAGAGGRPPEE
ncbi:MAG TPA: hypothetical protein EYH34_17655 [Planctomycetes bacterium]|nr:hypothetical protein [Planctomycetota bacterium]